MSQNKPPRPKSPWHSRPSGSKSLFTASLNSRSLNKTKNKVLKILSEHLGVEPSDLNETDNFVDDLSMNPTSITDFLVFLSNGGVDTTKIDFSEILTVGELIEFISEEEI